MVMPESDAATLADDHVALDCLAGDALCAGVGCRHAGDDLGEFRTGDVVLPGSAFRSHR